MLGLLILARIIITFRYLMFKRNFLLWPNTFIASPSIEFFITVVKIPLLSHRTNYLILIKVHWASHKINIVLCVYKYPFLVIRGRGIIRTISTMEIKSSLRLR